MVRPLSARVAAIALVPCVLAMPRAQSPVAVIDGRVVLQLGARDMLNLARTSWRCTTSARLDDPPRQGYMYFHPSGDVKMVQVVPASNRERGNNILWWPTREEYNIDDPTGRKWTDPEWLDAGNIWASRRDHARIMYGSPPGLILLSVPRNGTMYARSAELDARSRKLVDGGEADVFALSGQPSPSPTMTCELRPGWLQ